MNTQRTITPGSPPTRRLEPRTRVLHVALCALVVLVAFVLRVHRLDTASLRGDESFTVLFSAYPLPELIEGIRSIEPNPPLYYLLLRGAMALWGHSDFVTRFVSVLFGVLAVPLLYRLGRALFAGTPRLGQTAGLWGALLLALNPYQVWHSQDVRNYTLWPALSLASLYLLLRALRENRWSCWAVYAITALASLYTHYYDAFVVLAAATYVLIYYRRDRPRLKRAIIVAAIVSALYLPWLLWGSSRPLSYVDTTPAVPGPVGIVSRSLAAFALGETLPQALVPPFLSAAFLLLALGLWFAFREDRRAFAFLLLYLAVPSLCVALLAQWRPLFRERYLNVIAPGYYLAFGLALTALTRLHRGAIAASAVGAGLLLVPSALSLGHYYYDPRYAKSPDWRGLAAHLEAQVGAKDVIVETYPDPTLAYYYRGPASRLVLPDRSAVDQIGDLAVDRAATGETLQRLVDQHARLWLLPQRSTWDPDGFVEGWLNRRAHKVHEEQVSGFRLAVYERGESPPPSVEHPAASRLGQAIEFLGYDLQIEGGCHKEDTADGGLRLTIADPRSCTLRLALYWGALTPMDVAYTVFTHLRDTEGHTRAQHDGQPQGGAFPTLEWLPGDVISDEHVLRLPAEAPPGPYSVSAGMYRLETGERLEAYDERGERWPGDAIPLALSIEVEP